MKFSDKKYYKKNTNPYQWSANHYYIMLIIRNIRMSCVYFAKEIEKQSVAF